MSRRQLTSLLLPALFSVAFAPARPAAAQESGDRGQVLYAELCAACHGDEGRGDGPTAERMGKKPRDFTLGAFKCRSTPTGMAPTDEDLQRVINRGLRGTLMMGFARSLEPGDDLALVAHVRSLSPPRPAEGSAVIDIPPAPDMTDDMIAEGRAVYGLLRCWSCHGADGRGQGPSAEGLLDDWGEPIRVYDFTRGRRYKCGGEDHDLYRLLHTGMTGSPMPSFAAAFLFGSDAVGNTSSLAAALGADAGARIDEWLAEQPAAAALDALSAGDRQALVELRTWSLIAYLRSLEGR